MISCLLFLRIPNEDINVPKTILTKEGVKIKDYVPEEQYNTYKPYADKFADKSSKIRPLLADLMKKFSEEYGSKEIETIYNSNVKMYVENTTAVSEILKSFELESEFFADCIKYWPHVERILKLLKYDSKKIKPIVEDLSKATSKTTFKDIAEAFELPTEWFYYMGEAAKGVMTTDTFSIRDCIAHLFIDSGDFFKLLEKLVDVVKDDKVTLDELVETINSAITAAQAAFYGVRKITASGLVLALTPIEHVLPKSKSEVEEMIDNYIAIIDEARKDSNLPEDFLEGIKSENSSYGQIYTLCKQAKKDSYFTIPEEDVIIFKKLVTYLDPQTPAMGFVMPTFGKYSIFNVLYQGNLSILNGIQDLISRDYNPEETKPTPEETEPTPEETEPEPTESKRKLQETEQESEEIVYNPEETLKEIKKYRTDEALFTSISLDDLLTAIFGIDLPLPELTVTINDLVKSSGVDPFDKETFTNTMKAIKSIFADHDDIFMTIGKFAEEIFGKLQKLDIEKATVEDFIKCITYGDEIISYLKACNEFKEKGAEMGDVVLLGINVKSSLEAISKLEKATINAVLDAIKTSTDEGKKLVANVKKSLDSLAVTTSADDLIKTLDNEKITNTYKFYQEVMVPIVGTSTDYFKLLTNMDMSETHFLLHDLVKEGASGKISFETVAKVGESTSDLKDGLAKEAKRGGLSAGAIAGIVIACLIIVAIIVAVCVYFFVIKPKSDGGNDEENKDEEQV
ncbi:hypothetical protein TVAG_086980 [Trichomonas vaginalis G3]|uniref:Uncharacterized protein n=1 Tax=Trichomonas vaginalis (strain ATCC PRA-98 / G3) TaxID=412133 RepID=A2G629_TRIV3|nr:hypothetical protein TVAGG3_1023580 [Trichomonas vaginalis G3]EAX87387.1 hypothetical protein TVAG_086980 [Trichomonas vaginalis G3]KAI5492313.1 hypothetical protein TVAGG3_1023580 [Trichomonas vaginalis G3]|eukprot:XP_001300317.1 hypothetical protein [Trichomonas vaginalis G3]